jgi:Glyoxalase-like domain
MFYPVTGRSCKSDHYNEESMSRLLWIIVLVALATVALAASGPGIEFDHIWIMVSPDAPERSALERAGFQISKDVNHHEGTGTSSITVELDNTYLELMWPDPKVPVSLGMERAAEKYHQRQLWRTSGWCPIGLGFRHATSSNEAFPFPIWTWTADWMPKGSVMEMLTPRDDTRSPALFIEPLALSDTGEQAARAKLYHHPIGVHRITALQLISPKTYQPIAALTYMQKQHLLSVKPGDEWIVELTFDDGKREKSKDLRPDLPLVIRY